MIKVRIPRRYVRAKGDDPVSSGLGDYDEPKYGSEQSLDDETEKSSSVEELSVRDINDKELDEWQSREEAGEEAVDDRSIEEIFGTNERTKAEETVLKVEESAEVSKPESGADIGRTVDSRFVVSFPSPSLRTLMTLSFSPRSYDNVSANTYVPP